MTSSVLVAGNAKTGTTGVYQAVKSALLRDGKRYHFMFEPTRAPQLRSLFRYAPDVPVLCKVMATNLDATGACVADFDKRVMTVRDPRDTLISELLFRPMVRRVAAGSDDDALGTFLSALREKERRPSSWSVCELYQLAEEVGIGSISFRRFAARLDAITGAIAEQRFHVLHYEAFVDGELAALSDYLEMPIANPQAPSADSWLSHIARSRSHGAWRHWFTPDDVEQLTPLFERFLNRHGYDPAAALDPRPSIDPASSSEYIERALAKRRAEVLVRYRRQWSPGEATEAECAQLRQQADDGDTLAAFRVATVYRRGNAVVRAEPAAALEHALRGATGGSVDAMRLAAELLRERDEPERARRWERESTYVEQEKDLETQVSKLSQRLRSLELSVPREEPGSNGHGMSPQLAEARREAESLRQELSRVRSSTSYRVGHALTRAARDPRRGGWVAVRELAGAARRLRARQPTR